MSDTIFDKILAKQIPAQIIYEDEDVLAFKDINPQAKIHVIVIPKKRARSMNEIHAWKPQEVGVFFQKVSLVANKLGVSESGFRTVLNTGSEGGQSVDYIHAHILGGEPLNGRFA